MAKSDRYRERMSRRSVLLLLLSVGLSLMPIRSPAPLVYNPGEGWTYEAVGGVGKSSSPAISAVAVSTTPVSCPTPMSTWLKSLPK